MFSSWGIDPSAAGYPLDERLDTMMQRVEERVASLPGIRGASFAFFCFNSGEWTTQIFVPAGRNWTMIPTSITISSALNISM